jgi:centractin
LCARSANNNVPAVTYELPDGQKIQLAATRFELCERLFVAPNAAHDAPPRTVHGVANASVRRADVDLQRDLFSSVCCESAYSVNDSRADIVLCGGNAMLPGFGERLMMELKDLCPPQVMHRSVT